MKVRAKVVRFSDDSTENTASVTLLVTRNETDVEIPLVLRRRGESVPQWKDEVRAALHAYLDDLRGAEIEWLTE